MRTILIFASLILSLSSCLKTDVLKDDEKHFREGDFFLSGDFENNLEFEYTIESINQSTSPDGPTCQPVIRYNLSPAFVAQLQNNWDGHRVALCVYDLRSRREDCFNTEDYSQAFTSARRGYVLCGTSLTISFTVKLLAPNDNVVATATKDYNLQVNL